MAEPALTGNERKYVLDCLESGWISSVGEYVERFEASLATYFEVRHAIVCCNGTVALHLALSALGIGEGDEVIVPTLTFVASANAVRYTGARPILVDCDPQSWQISPDAVRQAVSPSTKAIMPVHLYGHPAPMDELHAIAREHGLAVIEDAAEAHGATYKGRKVGGLGNVATLSFYGNKIVTSGEGGAVLTNDGRVAERVRLLRGQGQDPARRYWFIETGYNYRLTNVQAAIGLAQMEDIHWHLQRRREVAAWYHELFSVTLPQIQEQVEQPWADSANWMNTFLLPRDFRHSRDETMDELLQQGVESRPLFFPLHTLPIYAPDQTMPCPVAEDVASRGISLPSSAQLTREDVRDVVEAMASLA